MRGPAGFLLPTQAQGDLNRLPFPPATCTRVAGFLLHSPNGMRVCVRTERGVMSAEGIYTENRELSAPVGCIYWMQERCSPRIRS